MLVCLFTFTVAAQQAPPTNASAPAAGQSPSDKDAADKDKDKAAPNSNGQGTNAGTSNDRLFYTLPNFLTMRSTGQLPPLTAGQKFKVVARGSFDYVLYPWYGFLSGISQWEDSEPGYGQGAEGYGKRFASSFADGTIENFFTGAIFPSVLHQDPRFYQTSEGSFMHRTEYAVSRIFVTFGDSGKTQFNYSEIVGSALSAAISTNTYHPRAFITKRFDPATDTALFIHNSSDRTLSNTLSVWGTQVGYDTLTIVVKEFWPDVQRMITHKRRGETADSQKPATAK